MAEHRYYTCNLCEALCGLQFTVEDGRITDVRGDAEDVLSRGHICPKGPALREVLEDPDRLRSPMRRTASGWEPTGWGEAMDEVARRLGDIAREHGRDAIGYYIGNPSVHSHGGSIGALLLSSALRTRNRYDANSQDANPRLYACMEVYGDALSVPVPDVDRTDWFLILGANPAASSGSLMSLGDVRGRLRGIRERGGKIVVVDPRRSETAALADEHHFIRPGGDAALLLAMLEVLFADGRVDEDAVEKIASGLPSLRALARRFPPERVADAIGVAPDTIRRLARELAAAERAVVYARAGTCQNEFGPVASWLVEAINVVTGHFDSEGGAMFAEPAADALPMARLILGSHRDRYRSRVRGLPEFMGSLPAAVMAEEMETPGDGQVRGFVCYAGNPVLSTPNGERLGRALDGLEFMVAINLYLNETSRHAHVVLPPTHALEHSNYDLVLLGFAVRNVAKWSAPVVARPPDGRDDFEILAELALRLGLPELPLVSPLLRGLGRRLARGAPDRLVDLLLRTGPHRLSLAALRAAPHGIDLGPLRPAQRRRHVRTPDRRVRLAPEALVADVARLERWLAAGPLPSLSLIGRRHLRSNNSWLHNAPSLVKGPDRSRLLMHPLDASARGLQDGGVVRVRSRVGEVEARLAITDEVMPGVVSLPHGFGHAAAAGTLRVAGALAGPNVNALTDELLVEPLVGTAILNGVPVGVEAAPRG